MATVAIGDVHGNLPALTDLLEQVGHVVRSGDVIVFLGDYIDRGPYSRGCIDAILRFRDESPAEAVCLRGNHEDWLLRTQADYSRHSWLLGMDALETIRSYSLEAERALLDALERTGLGLYLGRTKLPYGAFFDAMPEAHRTFFAGLALSFRRDGCIFTHAGLNPRLASLADQPADSCIWGDAEFPDAYTGDETVVYGHWNNATVDSDGWPRPRAIGNTIGIDTIAHGILTAIRLPDREVIQSRRYVLGPPSVLNT
jgi:serine/threonine protein phosphatase 1